MEYTQLGSTGLKVSRFGLGCMRFPSDKTEAVKMVRYAIDNGVNYFDTAYVYGNSEIITGEALQDGYRKKITLTTKSPIWNIQSDSDFEKYLDEELLRLKTDYIDMYLLHNLNPANWDKVKKYNGLMFLDRMIEKGKIRHKGFSIHSTTAAFKDIVNAYHWEMAQIQLNILHEHYQVGIDGLKYGAEKGLGMVIMEPLLGGDIVNNTPPEVKKLIGEYAEKRSLVEWCFRWLYNMPEISVILSGTNTLEQLKDNLRIFEESKPNVMSSGDRELIKAIQDVYENIKTITCGGCKYCMPCPQGLNIPEIFKLYNQFMSFNKPMGTTLFYERNMVAFGIGADSCVNCGNCKAHCPQHLEIPDLMQNIHEELMSKK
ncbi:MAG: aldo/keto reductase [Spirochaetaceae bacterium]|nr:aldo/keto reductase [Spirochaetaceae bacterium]